MTTPKVFSAIFIGLAFVCAVVFGSQPAQFWLLAAIAISTLETKK
jgi:uncharacterized membrane protein YgaE (UPF0421/DUF939 family)